MPVKTHTGENLNMIYRVFATVNFVLGLWAATIGSAPVVAVGALIGGGLFAIADAIKVRS